MPSIRHRAHARCGRCTKQDQIVIRKQVNPPSRRATRWWSAPSRFTTASLTLLRKAALHRRRDSAESDTWVGQTPVGIRVPRVD
jgi:hypothetical protein